MSKSSTLNNDSAYVNQKGSTIKRFTGAGGTMKVENDVPTIFNPRKPRLSQSNAVLTSDHRPYGPFSHVLSRSESRT